MILYQGWWDSPAKYYRLHQALFITFKDQVEKSIQLYINNLYIYIFISLYSILCLSVPIHLLYYTMLSFIELLKSIMYPLLENTKVIHNTLLLSIVLSLASMNIFSENLSLVDSITTENKSLIFLCVKTVFFQLTHIMCFWNDSL